MERRRRARPAPLPGVGAAAGGREPHRRHDPARARLRRGADHDDPRRQGAGVPDHGRQRPHHRARRRVGATRRRLAQRHVDDRQQAGRRDLRRLQADRRADERRRAAPPAVRGVHARDRPPRRLAPPRAAEARRRRQPHAERHAAGRRSERQTRRPAHTSWSPTRATSRSRASRPTSSSGATSAAWEAERERALAVAGRRLTVSATRLAEDLAWNDPGAATDEGLRKDAVDLELPPWQRGRYGTAVGRAVHGTLQFCDLEHGHDIDGLAAGQCAAEGIIGLEDVGRGARPLSALGTRRAARR